MSRPHSHALPHESKVAEHRRRVRTRLWYVGLGALVLIVVAVIALAHWSYIRVQKIDISGASTISGDAMQAYISQELSGTYGWILPKNNIVLFSTNTIANNVRAQFPRIETISVRRTSFSTLAIAITERAPAGRWCGKEVPVSVSTSSVISSTTITTPEVPPVVPVVSVEQCTLLDVTGLAYERETAGDGMDALPAWYGPLAGDGVLLPAQFLTPKDFASLRALAEAIAGQVNAGALVSVSADADGNGRAAFTNGFSVLFKTTDDAGVVMDHLSAALTSPIFSGRATADFEYLDIRFGERLYYKSRG